MILVVDMYIMLTMDLACMWNQKAIDNIKNFQDLNNSTRNKKEKGKRKTKQMEAFFFFFFHNTEGSFTLTFTLIFDYITFRAEDQMRKYGTLQNCRGPFLSVALSTLPIRHFLSSQS